MLIQSSAYAASFSRATGVHLNLGAKPYWPVYAEAARLGCPVVVHGGGHWDLGHGDDERFYRRQCYWSSYVSRDRFG